MKKKTLIISGILLLAVVAIFTLGVTAPPESVERAGISGSTVDLDSESKQVSSTAPYNKEASTFNFEGFGPGKSHLATFDEITINIEKDKESNIIGLQGTINPSSVNTGIERLDTHLKTNQFFNVEKYPEITFKSKEIKDGIMSGDLTFLGVTKTIDFPVEITKEAIVADFVLDTAQFGADFGKFANPEVRISFNLRE